MKRIRKRILGVAIGLALGWMAQGYVTQWWQPTVAVADVAQAQETQAALDAKADAGKAHNAGAAGQMADAIDAPFAGAEQLMPDGDDMRGFMVLTVLTLGLFGAAIIIGAPALSFADRHRPDPADDLHHGHTPEPVVHVHKGSH